jgi:hypothetical protein
MEKQRDGGLERRRLEKERGLKGRSPRFEHRGGTVSKAIATE